MTFELTSETYCLEPDAHYPFYITAKRYTPVKLSAPRSATDEPLTLILLHSVSFQKETWEPTIQDLFSHFSRKGSTNDIEAWSIECPNHGYSAILNEKILRHSDLKLIGFDSEKYARAAHRFLMCSEKLTNVNLMERNLVGIAHSIGVSSLSLLLHLQPTPKFTMSVLIEPLLSPNGQEPLNGFRENLIRGVCERRDVWSSRQEARRTLQGKGQTWDPRVFDVYLKHGLRPYSALKSYEMPVASESVTLCCSREQEAIMYTDMDCVTKPIAYLDISCGRIPIHVIFGAINDAIPRAVQDALVQSFSPLGFASVTKIPGAGHLVLQQAPNALAYILAGILDGHTREAAWGREHSIPLLAKL